MNNLEELATDELWALVEANAKAAQRHTNWLDCLDAVRICAALIDSRIQSFHRKARAEKLLRRHGVPAQTAGWTSSKEGVKA